jgi:hypothetical protein
MRKRLLIVCDIVLVLCVWLLLRRAPEQPPKTESPEVQAPLTNQPLASQPAQPANVAVAAQNTATKPPSDFAADAVHRGSPEGIKEMQQRALADWQRPIEFYGKVVDENTNPVAGASVTFGWSESPTEEAARKATTTSDANGLFSLHGEHGPALDVWVGKGGYYSSHGGQWGFSYMGAIAGFKPDSSNPVIFQLRKKGQGAELVTSENGMRPDLAVRVPINGDPVSVDLLDKKTGATGDLAVSQIKPDYGHWQQATNWSFHMSIPSGGFVGQDDEFPFEAPASGYQSTIDLNFVQGDPDWTTHFVTNYYIVFGQPQKYGWLRVEGDIAQETVFLKYAINPTGSQNLEPGP